MSKSSPLGNLGEPICAHCGETIHLHDMNDNWGSGSWHHSDGREATLTWAFSDRNKEGHDGKPLDNRTPEHELIRIAKHGGSLGIPRYSHFADNLFGDEDQYEVLKKTQSFLSQVQMGRRLKAQMPRKTKPKSNRTR